MKGETKTKPAGRSATTPKRSAQLVERAREEFGERGMRFTPLREQVFSEIACVRGSIGAYEILQNLATKGEKLAPISIYRSLDALLDAGVIHRLESRNAYFACRRHEHGKKGRPIFLTCETCGEVSEISAQNVFDEIKKQVEAEGAVPRVKFVEVTGTCPRCAKKSAGKPKS